MTWRLILLPLFFACSLALPAQSPLYYPPQTGNAWATLSPDSLSFCQERIDSLYAWLESVNSRSFVLLKDGRIVLEKYFGAANQESYWYWASAGKSLTAFMVGQAQEAGLLDIERPVSDYLGVGWTSCSPDKEALIAVRNQLSMTNGLDDALPVTPAIPDPDNCLLPECLVYKADAGSRWAYHNAPYRLIHRVLENASGQSLADFTKAYVLDRTGMKGFWLDHVMYGRARDMARFGLLCLGRGVWDGDTLLSDQDYFDAMITPSQALNRAYGYLWWLNGQPSFMAPGFQWVIPGQLYPQAPDDLYAALGRDDQIIHVVPSRSWVVVRQGPKSGDSPFVFGRQLWDRLNQLQCASVSQSAPSAEAGVSLPSPNPAADGWRVSCDVPVDVVEVWGVDGRFWRRIHALPKTGLIEIQVEGLPAGVYVLRLRAQGAWIYRKALKG